MGANPNRISSSARQGEGSESERKGATFGLRVSIWWEWNMSGRWPDVWPSTALGITSR